MIDITAPIQTNDPRGPKSSNRYERRRMHLSVWRAQNRERLREYGRQWKTAHPDRVRIHREAEYKRRRQKRRRLRLRQKAQRSRRALQRLRVTDPSAWYALTGGAN
jgi:hypothetical protein